MTEMLTAKEMQTLLQVDRSTIYRMAEAGRLPAIKVGKQWRFPADQIDSWFQTRIVTPTPTANVEHTGEHNANSQDLADILPLDCVQLIQDTFAELLGVMLVVTDMEANPITRPSYTCGLFDAVHDVPNALQKCIQSWRELATAIELEPHFGHSHLGLLCARAVIPVGAQLKGMVVAGCLAPETWPPSADEITEMAKLFEVEEDVLTPHINEVFYLEKDQRDGVLLYLQRIANIVAHIVNERKTLIGRLAAIADLTSI